ncbi:MULTISPECIES: hypothetical protein [Streptomyces violaceusniger group]|uniref:Transposase n=2 Tax=Streptomyces rhizosphaericus TaxID=114699 RepID=A0ABN1R5Q5_9ACTN|nr:MULTISPECIES: hypothetical protein [Streptomyces violaceusniger group]
MEQGVQLTGADGLMTALTRRELQTVLEVEMAGHLGYDRGDPAGRGAANVSNGSVLSGPGTRASLPHSPAAR